MNDYTKKSRLIFYALVNMHWRTYGHWSGFVGNALKSIFIPRLESTICLQTAQKKISIFIYQWKSDSNLESNQFYLKKSYTWLSQFIFRINYNRLMKYSYFGWIPGGAFVSTGNYAVNLIIFCMRIGLYFKGLCMWKDVNNMLLCFCINIRL